MYDWGGGTIEMNEVFAWLWRCQFARVRFLVCVLAVTLAAIMSPLEALAQGAATAKKAPSVTPPSANPHCVPPSSLPLLSWWPGDLNANDIQDGNPGALSGGTTFTAGKVGPAFSFNGTGAEVVIDKTSSSNLKIMPGNFSIDAWVKIEFNPVTVPQNSRVIFSNYAGVPSYGLFITYQNKAAFTFRPSGL